MKYSILFIIHCYWFLIPKSRRNTCLFCESCSNYVYRITKNNGFIGGLKAFNYRFRNCRPGYQIIDLHGKPHLITANQKLLQQEEISAIIIKN